MTPYRRAVVRVISWLSDNLETCEEDSEDRPAWEDMIQAILDVLANHPEEKE